jgi:hypothetical protein
LRRQTFRASTGDPFKSLCGVQMKKVKKQERQPRPFSTEPADAIVKKMMELGWAYTRENYLALMFLGNPPAEPLDPEIEFDLARSSEF